MAVTRNPQTHMAETRVEHRELEEALQERFETQDEAKRHQIAVAKMKKIIKTELKLEAGTKEEPKLYRIGEWCISLAHISGGGFELKEWDSVSIGFVDDTPSE